MNNSTPSRRTVAKSAAWAAPVIAIGVAAPAASASTTDTPPGLQGWVTVTESCSPRSGTQLAIDGAGSYPDRGLWVFNTTPTTTIADATMTFYFPSNLKLTWSYAAGGSRLWSPLTRDTSAPSITGMTAYTTRYSGGFVHVPGGAPGKPAYSYAEGQPRFAAEPLPYGHCQSTILAYARRSVVVDNEQISFQRGPISLRPTFARNSVSHADAGTAAVTTLSAGL